MDLKEMKKQLYDRNFTKFGFDMNLFVSISAALLVLGFVGFTIVFPHQSADLFASINKIINEKLSWLYILIINATFIFLIVLGFSKYGNIRFGGSIAKPEYSNFAWYSMLFSAGIGIGIFFYGVSEPIYHLVIPIDLQSGSQFDNFKIMFLHWGVHAWAVYGLIAVGLGYFFYNKQLPFAFRSLFYPLIKDKIYGILGDIIDTIAVLAVLFGLAASLGLGAQQINSGLNYIFGIPLNPSVQVIIITVITLFATMSVASGVSKGIKWLSEINLILSTVLLIGILLIGPTIYILSTYFSSMGLYLSNIFKISFFTAIQSEDVAWQGTWTIFYWAWWISWAPFVGTFIARISKGRSIKEVALGSILIPTVITTFAMTILGASSIHTNTLYDGVIEKAIDYNVATSMFEMFHYLTSSPALKMILSSVGVIVIVLFFITSSDSGSLVVSNLTSSGRAKPPIGQKIFWAFMEGAIALSVLLIGGKEALTTIQSAVIILALPFSLLLVSVMISLTKELKINYSEHIE